MTEKSHPLSENVYCILHEVLHPVKGMASVSILQGKVPQIIEASINQFGQISEELHTEIIALYRNPSTRINLQSPDIAAEQLRFLSREWEKKIEKLSQLIAQIDAADVRLEDELLNPILNKTLPQALERFIEKVACVKTTKSKHLMMNNGFFFVLQGEKEKDQ